MSTAPPPGAVARAHGAAVRLGGLPHDRQPQPGARQPARRGRRGRSGRRRTAGPPRRCPARGRARAAPRRGASPPRARRACLAALSSRFATARSRRLRTPSTSSAPGRGLERARRARAAARARPPRRRARRAQRLELGRGLLVAREVDEVGDERVSSSSWATRSRAAARGRRARARRGASTSRLVRSEVSGVRSSCEASATSRRCARWESSSASSIVLNAPARRASSSSPVALDAPREVARAGDVLGGVGELGARA